MDFTQYITQVNELTSYVQQGLFLQTRTPLYTPIRIDAGTAATIPAVGGLYYLFDRNTALQMQWGSAVGGVPEDVIDFPEWFTLKDRVMPKNKFYLAEFMSLDFNPLQSVAASAGANTLNVFSVDNKARIINSDTYIEIRPNDKDVQWKVPLRHIGDYFYNHVSVSDMNAAASTYHVNTLTHANFDKFGGRYPLFPDENTPGLLFTPDDVISIKLQLVQALPTVIVETRFKVTLEGWYYRHL